MKICAVICEYNPFHNGHKKQLAEIREKSGCDAILCVMSGNFVQRGEAAVLSKRERARHAIENGADIVTELPAAFAVSPAELFARGAVKLICDLPAVGTLAFGCESGDRESFMTAARATLREDKAFKAALKEGMKDGTSYLKARNAAVLQFNADVDESLLNSPNNILGTEYCRSLLLFGSKIEPLPLLRTGAGYSDTALHEDFSSASALRGVLGSPDRKVQKVLKRNLPASVYADVKNYRPFESQTALLCALLAADSEKVALVPDCSEGLENRIKAMTRSNPSFEAMMEKTVSKRYTRARIKRILVQNFLGITYRAVHDFLEEPLYHKVLAVRSDGKDELLKALGDGSFPVVTRRSDYALFSKAAADCFAIDSRANDLYNVLAGTQISDFETLFV